MLASIPRYLFYLMIAGFIIGTAQSACDLALQAEPMWRGGLLDWIATTFYALNLPGVIGAIGNSKYDQADTIAMANIFEYAPVFGVFNALFYAAIGAIVRYPCVRLWRRWGGARRAA